MACFVVPVAEAVVVGAAALVAKSQEKKKETQTFTYTAKDGITTVSYTHLTLPTIRLV